MYDYGNMLGLKKNRIFYTLDHVLVPINTLSKPKDVEKIFSKCKIKFFKKLNRGSSKDEIENIFKFKKKIPTQKLYYIFGTGENRYLFKKI